MKTVLSSLASTLALFPKIVTVGSVPVLSASSEVRVRVTISLTLPKEVSSLSDTITTDAPLSVLVKLGAVLSKLTPLSPPKRAVATAAAVFPARSA